MQQRDQGAGFEIGSSRLHIPLRPTIGFVDALIGSQSEAQ